VIVLRNSQEQSNTHCDSNLGPIKVIKHIPLENINLLLTGGDFYAIATRTKARAVETALVHPKVIVTGAYSQHQFAETR
jgi:hypothetical protein